jgi:hypothetical protein
MGDRVQRLELTARFDFDFAGAVDIDDLIENLSGIAINDGLAWTVSDEGRTFECFSFDGTQFELRAQYSLDDFFPDLPEGKEADLEAVDFFEGRLWLCGSHSRVRREVHYDGRLNSAFRRRPSRHLLGSIAVTKDGVPLADTARSMAFKGDESLRRLLRPNPFLSAFLDLPSKENGLDIEGMAVFSDKIMVGLRGPVIDSHASIVSISREPALPTEKSSIDLHLVNLVGLGVRDLCRFQDAVIILAGPVTAAAGPFRIYRWHPTAGGPTEKAELLYEWPLGDEHPEGIRPYESQGKIGFLVVYDGPSAPRRNGIKVAADWFELTGPGEQ